MRIRHEIENPQEVAFTPERDRRSDRLGDARAAARPAGAVRLHRAQVPHDEAQRVDALGLPGIGVEQEETGRRVDSVGTLASTVIGYVGIDENGLAGSSRRTRRAARRLRKILVQEDDLGRPIPITRENIVKPPKDGLSSS